MKKTDFKQLSREQLRKVKGGNRTSADDCGCGLLCGGIRCPPGLCCSQYGYCGTTADYCTQFCQHEYGECWD